MSARQEQIALALVIFMVIGLCIVLQVGPVILGALIVLEFAAVYWSEQRVKRERDSA